MTTDLPGHDMVPVRGDQLPSQADMGQIAQAHLEAMQWREEIIAQRIPAVLKRTSPRHWIDYGGETDPRPEDEAAVIFATMLGISYRWLPQPDGKNYSERAIDGKPGDYEVCVEIEGTGFGRTVQDIGSCRSDDKFLSAGKRRASEGRALWSDVKKKAMANGIVRLLQALGMRGITWDDLERAGIKRADCQRVDFAEGEGAAAKRAQRSQVSKPCPQCTKTPCEKCESTGKGGMLTLRTSARGNFLGCSHYPACKHTEEPVAEPAETEQAPAPQAVAEDTPTVAQLRKEIADLVPQAFTDGTQPGDWFNSTYGKGWTALDLQELLACRTALQERIAAAGEQAGLPGV